MVCLGNIAISFNVAAIAAAVPEISAQMGISEFIGAKVIPYYLLPYGLGALIYAPLTHRYSYGRILGLSLLVFALSCWICAQSASLGALLIGRVGMGVSAAGAIPLGLMILGDFFPKEIRGRLVGGFFSCSFVASIAGIVVGGLADWRWLFVIPALLAVGTVGIAWFGKPPELRRVHGVVVDYGRSLSKRAIKNIFVFIFLISFLYHGVFKWYGVYLHRVYGLERRGISLFFLVTVVGGFCGQMAGGYVSDKKGRLAACRLGVIGLGMSVMALGGMYPLAMLGGVLFLISFFWTMGHNGVSTTLTDFPDGDRSVIASLNSSVRFISGALGFWVSRFFVERSFGLTFLGIGLSILGMSLLIHWMNPQRQ